MPRVTGQVPIYYNHKNSGRPAGSGEFSVRYVDLPLGPLYPFGYGMSYTRFAYSDLKVAQSLFRSGANQISATITNQGSVAGTEIAQLYVRDLVGSVTRPVKELIGYQKVTLQPGEVRRVTFTLTPGDLAFTGADETSVVEPGEYHVWIGPNSQEGLQGSFTLLG
jgi:beta-glucosidase